MTDTAPEPRRRRRADQEKQAEQERLDREMREATLRAIAAWDRLRAARLAEAA